MNYRQYYEEYGEDKAELCRDPDDPGEGRCSECGQMCRPVKVDFGYGRLNIRGVWFTHHDYRYLSPCCDAEVEE
ncbi:MAG: hypothetical protein RBR16_13460 [Syntrophus sp. (in: bacteria)]|nr:hypothetical protein [Syntrophus sp. (in: bacteria)]